MHALKNPLAGLREYARERREEGEDEETAQLLTEATDRMQTMVEDTLGTLSETEADEATYSFSVAEILELARQRLDPTAEKANVKLIIEDVAPEIELDNLRANLLLPILLNLGQNAIEVSTEGRGKTGREARGEKLGISRKGRWRRRTRTISASDFSDQFKAPNPAEVEWVSPSAANWPNA